jgi:CubicO group peptidase (beta-lactamase class C family)
MLVLQDGKPVNERAFGWRDKEASRKMTVDTIFRIASQTKAVTSVAGGAGLLSTARDYAKFLEMIRNGGAICGVRVLSPRFVELMRTNQVGTLHSANGLGFGLGFEVTERYGANGMDSVGAFGWGGA